MLADDEQTSRLHALHDAYVWRVNTAIAAGRPDLANELADEYAVEVEALTGTSPAAHHPARPPSADPQLGWLRRLLSRLA
jgi:hypothetical protein